MQKAHEAYSNTAKVTDPPRQLEASLLLKAASQMQAVHDSWFEEQSALEPVLSYNRRLWTVFVSSVTKKECALPTDIRNNVASLGLFIFKQTLDLQLEPEPEKLLPLININRELAAGLNEKAA